MTEKHGSIYVWRVIYVQYVIYFSQERKKKSYINILFHDITFYTRT